MKSLILLLAIGSGAAVACAELGRVQEKAMRSAVYDLATGELRPGGAGTRFGPRIWAASGFDGWFWGQAANEIWIDWGDVGTGPVRIDGFRFGAVSGAPYGYEIRAWFGFLSPENGFGDADFPLALFDLRVPGIPPPPIPPPDPGVWYI